MLLDYSGTSKRAYAVMVSNHSTSSKQRVSIPSDHHSAKSGGKLSSTSKQDCDGVWGRERIQEDFDAMLYKEVCGLMRQKFN